MNSSTENPFIITSFPPSLTLDYTLSSGRTIVLKVFQNTKSLVMKVFPLSEQKMIYFNNEVKILESLSHPNILPLYKVSQHLDNYPDNAYSYILTPFCQNGTLYDLLKSKIKFDEIELRTYFHQLVEAVDYMHSKEIYHVDLKPCNVLVGDDFQFLIFDFDLSYQKGDKNLLSGGTPHYRAPELKSGKAKDLAKCDIYTLGIMLFTMHNGCKEPFLEYHNQLDENRVNFDMSPHLFWSSMEGFFSKYNMKIKWSDEFKLLFEKMVLKNPEDRWTLKEVKQSEWYNGETLSQEVLKTIMKDKYMNKR